ncbi:MAG: neutral zinc metallopeptidase [Thermomicrobiales bacterium]
MWHQDEHQRVLPRWVTAMVIAASSVLLLPSPGVTQTPTPAPGRSGFAGSSEAGTGYVGHEDEVFSILNDYWAGVFAASGLIYTAPNVVQVTAPTYGACGPMRPEEENAFYCARDATVYLFPQFMEKERDTLGDYAPITIIGHEWGHHIQALLDVSRADSRRFELQADCLSGVFMDQVEQRQLLDPGDFSEALDMSRAVGDDTLGLPIDAPGAHGTAEERIKSLVRGYGGGPEFGCKLPLVATGSPAPTPGIIRLPQPTQLPQAVPTAEVIQVPPRTSAVLQLPDVLPLNYASCFRIDGEGSFDFDQTVVNLGDTVDARRRMEVWGWQGNEYRQFGCDTPPTGHVGWVEVSLHHFNSAQSAQQAVDYFAVQRIAGTSLTYTPPPFVGDYAVAVTGPAVNGTEYTTYVASGSTLLRVTGVAPVGIPRDDVFIVAESLAGIRNP